MGAASGQRCGSLTQRELERARLQRESAHLLHHLHRHDVGGVGGTREACEREAVTLGVNPRVRVRVRLRVNPRVRVRVSLLLPATSQGTSCRAARHAASSFRSACAS